MAEGESSAPPFAFLALREPTFPHVVEIVNALEASFPARTSIGKIEVDEATLTLTVDGEQAIISRVDVPIPWGDLEIPCARSWLWKTATVEMRAHTSHLIVVFLGEKGTQIEQCLKLTRILAALSRCFSSVGVYWGHGGVVLNSSSLQEFADNASVAELPLLVWLELCVFPDSNGHLNMVTSGLEYFGCMEIEVIATQKPFPEVLQAVMGVAALTMGGDVFKDGDTFGPDAETRIKTKHTSSVWERPAQVLRLEF